MQVETITQVLQRWTQMAQSGKELLSMTAKSMEKRNIKTTLMNFRNMDKTKRTQLTPESHTNQPLFKLTKRVQVTQVLFLFQTLESHILQEPYTTQVLQPWTQMPLSGREKLSTMVKLMVKSNGKSGLMKCRNMERIKKKLLMKEFHMLQPLFKLTRWEDQQFQVLHLFLTQVFHTSRVLHTTQVLHLWTQMLQSGKELLSMMAKSTEKKNTKRMLTISKNTELIKRKLLTKDSHMPQL